MAVTLLLISSLTSGQNATDNPYPLQASGVGDFNLFWKIGRATLREDSEATVGHLELENISQNALDRTLIYGEYFDVRGRLCFSIVFAQDEGLGGVRTFVAPGGTGELHGLNWGLAPTSEPTSVRLYLAQQGLVGEKQPPRIWNHPMRSPVTIGASIPSDWDSFQLNSGYTSPNGNPEGLALADISINRDGVLDEVQVLNSSNPEIETWLRQFAQHLTYFPAWESGVPASGHVLLLLQITDEGPGPDTSRPAWNLPWLRSYSAGIVNEEVTPVTKLIFATPKGKIKLPGSAVWSEVPAGPRGFFQVFFVGSDWGRPAFKMIVDASAPHHLRRELVTSSPN